jgi:hypothetical protein
LQVANCKKIQKERILALELLWCGCSNIFMGQPKVSTYVHYSVLQANIVLETFVLKIRKLDLPTFKEIMI